MAHKVFTFIPDTVIAANKAILATTGVQLRDNTEFLKEQFDDTLPDRAVVHLYNHQHFY